MRSELCVGYGGILVGVDGSRNLTLFVPGYFEVKEYGGLLLQQPPSNFLKNCLMMVVKGAQLKSID